jgi:hypothetical protein
LYLPTPEVKRFAGCQEVPVTRVAGLPVFHHFGGTGVREEIEIGAIEDTILILDEKRALLSEASTSGHQVARSRRCIDGEIWILVEVSGDVVEISVHAPQMDPHKRLSRIPSE